MSPRSFISLALVFGLFLASTDGRAFKENRQKRQVVSDIWTTSTSNAQDCVSRDVYDDMGEINIGFDGYLDNEDCCFHFRPPLEGEFTVDLEFNMFDVEYHGSCNYDYLSYNTSGGFQGKDCGSKPPGYTRTLTSTGSFEVCFHSDGSQTGQGVNFYYFIYPGMPESLNFATTFQPDYFLPTTPTPSDYILPTTPTPPFTTTLSGPDYFLTTQVIDTNPGNTTYIPNNTTAVPSNVTSTPNSTCNRYLTAERGHFSSPGFNHSYPNNQDCVTTIRGLDTEYTIEITFARFNLESANRCQYDWLQFRWATNETEKACGDQWNNETVRLDVDGGNTTAMFHSDSSVTRRGFSASYVIRPRGVPRNASNCTYIAHGHHGMIQSLPGTGADYPSRLNCSYIFNVPSNHFLHLNFTTFDLEGGNGCPFDYVQVNGGRKWCGSEIHERRVNATGQVVLRFRSDGSVAERGFVAYYTIRAENGTMPTMPPANTTYIPMNTTYIPMNTTYFPMNTTFAPSNVTSTPNTTCNRYLTAERGHFSSPGFNQSYPNNQDCVTTIRGLDTEYTIEITFARFNLERANRCQYDWLQFRWATNETEKACGHQWTNETVRFDVDDGNVTAVFHSDSSVTEGGYSASYVIRPRGVPRNASNCTFIAHGHHGMIQSLPGTGADYPSRLNCSYIFNVPNNHFLHLNFTTFDLEGGSRCPFDYVQVNGGHKWCGSEIHERRVNATGQVILRFRSDGSVARRGFVAYYNIREENGTTPFPPHANTTYIPVNTTYSPVNTTYSPVNTTYSPVNTTYIPSNTTTLSNISNSNCNFNSEDLEGSYNLPTDYLGFYGNREHCDITLTSSSLPHVTTIDFSSFDVEYHRSCDYDYLDVKIGNATVDKLCGNSRGSFTKQYSTAQPVLNMAFVSDGSFGGRGFAFNYSTDIVYCNATINGTSGSFASPPSGYSNNMRCTYTIHTPVPVQLLFHFSKFDVEYASDCGYDTLSMGRDRLCGDSIGSKTYDSDGTFVITFTSDGSVTKEGFYMSFTSTPIAEV